MAHDPDWLGRFAADWGLEHEPRLRRDDTHRSLRYRARLNDERPHRHHPNT
jgi:hypothetical protein